MASSRADSLQIIVQNMAGRAVAFDIDAETTVGALQQRVHAERLVECAIGQQRLFIDQSISSSDAASASDHEAPVHVTLDDRTRTLASYGVVADATVFVVVRAHWPGEHQRTIGGVKGGGNDQFHCPSGVCASPDGELLFVADRNNHRVQVLRAADGAHLRTFGGGFEGRDKGGSGVGEMHRPCGVSVSPDGELLFVADGWNNRVQVLRASDGAHVRTIGGTLESRGPVLMVAQAAAGQLYQPTSVHCTAAGELFVADSRNCVHVWRAADGAHVRTYGGGGGMFGGVFSGPKGVCVAASTDELFVADAGHDCVRVLRASDGTRLRTIGSGVRGRGDDEFDRPSGVCVVEADDLLFVADCGNHRVQVMRASDGAYVRSYGGHGSYDGQMYCPVGVFVTVHNELVVVEQDNHRVQVLMA